MARAVVVNSLGGSVKGELEGVRTGTPEGGFDGLSESRPARRVSGDREAGPSRIILLDFSTEYGNLDALCGISTIFHCWQLIKMFKLCWG